MNALRSIGGHVVSLVVVVLGACDPGGGGGGVRVSPCANGVQDPGEAGVDCGGACGACPGSACAAPTECASRSCVGELCAAPTCTDGIKNGAELQIDCGGACGACRPATCSNGSQDPNETGVDCGGPCAACATGDCDNEVQDPGEVGVDCGGPCTPCGQAPTCTDRFENQDETDVDCGGLTCPKCGVGDTCDGPADCVTGVCAGGECGDAAPTCTNGDKDLGESDVDCGGSCPACATNKNCGDHDDCLSSTCIFGVCRDPSCTDDVQNQGESDVDCGGTRCGGCDDGLRCARTADCASQVCEGSKCVSCDDGVQNQDESDRDCGGACAACANEKRCGAPSDCASRTCIGGVCKPEGTSAGTCEIEDDCGPGFYCEWLWNEASGASAGWDKDCLGERAGGQPGAACETTDDCAGLGCFNGLCSELCQSDATCFSGAICASEEELHDTDGDDQVDVLLPFEYCLGFTGGGGSCWGPADCTSGKRCTIYLDENLAGQSLDPDGPYKAVGRCENKVVGGAADGAQCEANLDCASGLCGAQGVCTYPCDAGSECTPITINSVNYKRLCVSRIPWGGGALDDPTRFVRRSECAAFVETGPLASCGPESATPYVCGSGFACLASFIAFGPDFKAKAEWRCFSHPDGFADLGDACSDPASCKSRICVDADSGDGYCGQPCDSQDDCGASGLTCQSETIIERKGKYTSNGLSVGTCMR